MPRVIWKGSISFGLVHVPVALYSAEQTKEELHFTMLDRRNMAPVGYRRYNKSTGEEVPWDEIVKGYEYAEDEYVVLGEEDFRRANPGATQTVEIFQFVSQDEIPLPFYDRPYYLEPIRRGDKGYALLRETLRRTAKVGLGRVVLRNRQHLAALLPVEDMLLLELLRYQYELRSYQDLRLPSGKTGDLGITPKELEMAERLVNDMAEPWEPSQYRDEYHEDLLRIIDEKVAAGETKLIREPEEEAVAPEKAEVIDLMAMLKRSVEEKEKGERKPAKQSAAAGRRKKTGDKGKSATGRSRRRA